MRDAGAMFGAASLVPFPLRGRAGLPSGPGRRLADPAKNGTEPADVRP